MSENKEPIKLNLGCGPKKLSGYINIDLDPQYHPDLCFNIKDILCFYEVDTVDTILASDVLEHVGRLEIDDVLKCLYMVLKPGGQMIIKTPNLESIIGAYKVGEIPAMELVRKIYGNQETFLNTHRTGFTPELLKSLLESVGFKVFKIQERLDGGDWSNMAIRCQK